MKKTISILITALFVIGLCSCGGNNKTSNQNSTANKTTASDVSESGSKSSQNTDTVVVPNVVGMNVDVATKELEELGLVVESEPVYKAYVRRHQEYILADIGTVTEQEKYDNNYIILYYQEKGNRFEYTENQDNTITLGAATSYNPNEEFIIPAFYKNKKVVALSTECVGFLNRISEEFNIPAIKIPEGVIVQSNIECNNIIYYNPNAAR